MLSGLILAVLLLLATSSARTTGQPCLCSALQPAGLQVNCSSLNLMELPHLPPDTTELHAQDNRLTSVSPGVFDRLVGLKKVSLSGNPFHCDCRIQYLRNWLLKNRAIVSKEPTCASPSSVAQKAITELTDDYFSSYSPASCTGGTFNTIMGVMLCCLIVLLLWCLRLAKTSTITLYIDERHSGFEANSLRSQRPGHRRRRHAAQSEEDSHSLTSEEDLEKSPINMDLLPQVLDVLHKKHNIKISLPERPLRLLPWNYKNTASDKQS
ncbi:glycoprotein IX (platelet) isoform X1 [Chelmon rostratus]|uniref:glycoprotein IX (platelet) isoform X1 n=2 Tax=Chelmon rostratus TaxID=109905 RepID=UPI001BE7D17B|nr:glycoprotein IX (platelet) isoform X1 [Chelmon rostratus]